ncbi:MAG TPA: hypothetical protein DCG89_04735, partial [Spartobacteria bacterium]|nr:hypothetical protein [Spartobacteria bacterium]
IFRPPKSHTKFCCIRLVDRLPLQRRTNSLPVSRSISRICMFTRFAHSQADGGRAAASSQIANAMAASKEMNTTLAKFVERLRVEAARRRLEESRNSLETIAGECGFGNVNSMRNVSSRRR